MSHIVEFTISGLAGRKGNYSRKLNEDVNIFFGLNGSGKTSLLKILHSAMSGDTDILRNVPFKHAEVKLCSTRLEKDIIHTCKINQVVSNSLGDKEPSLSQILFYPDDLPESLKRELILSRQHDRETHWDISPKKPKFKGLRHTYLLVSRPYLIKRPERLPLSEEQLDLLFARNLQDLWKNYSTGMLSNIRKVQEDGLANILKTILSATDSGDIEPSINESVDVETAYNQMNTFLRRQKAISEILGSREDFIQRYEKDTRLQKIVSDINTIEKEIEQAMAPRQNLQKLVQKMFSHKQIEFTDSEILVKNEDNDSLGLHLLSSGERQLMLIFLETFLAGDNPILIDEPEMSMHIDWQTELVSAIRQLNPKAQLILATHSPEIMAEVADDKVFRLNYE